MSATPAILAENLVKRYPVFRGFRDLARRPFDRRVTSYGSTADGAALTPPSARRRTG